jgi:hypothetical protein
MNSQRFFKSAKSLVRDPDKEPVNAYLDDECGHVQRLGMESRLQPGGHSLLQTADKREIQAKQRLTG